MLKISCWNVKDTSMNILVNFKVDVYFYSDKVQHLCLLDVNASLQLYVHKEANISKYSKICFPPHSVLKLLAYAFGDIFPLTSSFRTIFALSIIWFS